MLSELLIRGPVPQGHLSLHAFRILRESEYLILEQFIQTFKILNRDGLLNVLIFALLTDFLDFVLAPGAFSVV